MLRWLLKKALNKIKAPMLLIFGLSVLFSGLSISYSHGALSGPGEIKVTGEQRKWHKLTLEVAGPEMSEQGQENPFLDIRLEVIFRKGSKEYIVPGYYAADGKAGESSAESGNVWKVHFTPDAEGQWDYTISFRKGKGIAVGEDKTAGTVLAGDGTRGSFTVGPGDKSLPDNRARGRLEYVGGHYLRYAESGEYFLKGGPDAPENFLAYADFDGTQNKDGISDKYIKTWSAHQQDWKIGDPSWQGSKGKGMIGAINYLASEGLNVFSFLTMNILGDDKNVFPYIKYNGTLSDKPVEDRLRFDVSKLAQWEKVFEHAETLGMFLHFKLQETENDVLLDGGRLGVERKLYYREMIARFGHHLSLNWNLGEEYRLWAKTDDTTNEYLKQYGQYFKSHDPYHHHVVVHTHPDKKQEVYPYILGESSGLTGASLQSHYSQVHEETKHWLSASAKAGKPWVVANDEQNPHQEGVLPDGKVHNHDIMRKQALWGNLMAGGSGCEFYFGYEYDHSDLTCEDWRSRDHFWDYVHHGLTFFRQHVPYWEMGSADELVGEKPESNSKYCLAKAGEVYVVYLADGGTASIDLSSAVGTYTVQWYNPRKGGGLLKGSVEKLSGSGGSIGTPPTEENGPGQDWVAVLQRSEDVPLQVSKLVLYDTDKQIIISDPLQDGAVIQLKDNISIVAVSVPAVVGSVRFAVDGKAESISNNQPYAIAGYAGGQAAEAGAFAEKNGVVMWEAESSPATGNWQLQTDIKGYAGSGYYTWTGANHFKSPPASGMIRYKVKITQAGNYEFVFRTKNTYEVRHEHNDSWIRIPTGQDVKGEHPLKGNWNKAYQSQANIWSWQAYTVDGVQNPMRVYLTAGVHEVWLAGRSIGHGVDRLGLYQYENISMTEEKLEAQPNAQQIEAGIKFNAWPLSLGQHTITATPFMLKDAQGQAGKPISISINVVGGGAIPEAPDNLKALSNINSIYLSWKDNAMDEEGFGIERKEKDGSYLQTSMVKANITSYKDETAEKGKTYYYRVRAINSYGKSGYSEEVEAKLEEPANILPDAKFTMNKKSGVLPLKISFDASNASDADGKIITYAWDFGDGQEATGKTTSHRYETEGIFEVVLTVIDDRNGEATTSKKVTVLPSVEIHGNTYYVSTSDGNDAYEGTSADRPWKTLEKVNSTQFLPGDTILFKRNNFWAENLVIPASGTASASIVFASYGEGEKPVFAPVRAAEVINIEGRSYVSVSDLHIIAAPYEKGLRIAGNAAFVSVTSCQVEGNAGNTSTRGIEYSALSKGEYPTYPSITHCEIYNFQEGIGGYAGLHEGGFIAENHVHSTASEGTDLIRAISGDYEGLEVSNNELTGWRDDAIDLYGGSNIIIEHNHIHHPVALSANGSGMGIKAGGVGPPQSKGNIIRYNEIHHITGSAAGLYDGISTNYGSYGAIYGNLIYAVKGNGITVTDGHDFWKIYHNTIISSDKTGILIGNAVNNIELINNIIGGKNADIEIHGANTIVNGYYNLLLNLQAKENPIAGDGIYVSETDIVNTADPVFANAEKEDFRLHESATGIDAGMSLENYTGDILGAPIKNLPDLGAYEYQGDKIIISNLPPVASFIAIGKGPLEINFDASASSDQDGTISSFHWDFGDGTTGDTEKVIHSFTSAGTYTVILTVKDNQDSFHQVSQLITIPSLENTLPIPNAGDNQSITLPLDELTLEGEGTDADGTVVSYHWKQIEGPNEAILSDTATSFVQISGLTAGKYVFQLTVTDDNGESAIDEVEILVKEETKENVLPVAFAGDDRTVILPADTVRLTGTGTDADGIIAAYQWRYEGSDEFQMEGENTPVLIIHGLSMGTYLFQLTVTDDKGESATDEVKITVKGSADVIRANKAFSPNGDGIDDMWVIENIEAIEECKLSIFNRAGQQVFEAAPYHNNWDATQNGHPLPSADYYYIIQCNGKQVKSGGIRVLR